MELVTVWNGAHKHTDQDLLCCEPVRQKIHACPTPAYMLPPRSATQGGYVADRVLACLEMADLTQRALMDRTGLPQKVIQNAVGRLQRTGQIRCVQDGGGRMPRVYRIVEG